jgi:hypothetical protein
VVADVVPDQPNDEPDHCHAAIVLRQRPTRIGGLHGAGCGFSVTLIRVRPDGASQGLADSGSMDTQPKRIVEGSPPLHVLIVGGASRRSKLHGAPLTLGVERPRCCPVLPSNRKRDPRSPR